jgi:DHA2 family multidrug resistance protein-like MFS transporter
VEEPAGIVEPSQRKWVVITTSLMTIMTMVDSTIANVALPTIARDINASAAASIWIVNGFQVGMVIGIVPFSQLADIVGYWRLYRIALIGFMLSSLACSLSHTLLALSAARFVQGFTGAALTVSGPPINRLAFPPKMLGRATGFAAMSVALGSAAGPIVSGLILAVAPWQWLFAINVPIALFGLALSWRTIPRTPGNQRPYDIASAAMSIIAFGVTFVAVDTLGHDGATPLGITELAVAVIAAVVFFRRQLTLPLPMFAVDLFAEMRFSLAAFACFGSFLSQTIAYISLPFALQTVLGYSPLQFAMLLLPWLLASAAIAPFAGHLADRFNSSRLAAIGMGIFGIGLLCTAFMGRDPAPFDIAWRLTLCGIGFGIFQSPNNRSIQGSAPRDRSGATQAIQAVARVTGQTVGATIVAVVFSAEAFKAGSGVTSSAVVVTLVISAGVAFIAAGASFWRGVITGSIPLARAS